MRLLASLLLVHVGCGGSLSIDNVTGWCTIRCRDRLRLSRDPAVNYMLFATRP